VLEEQGGLGGVDGINQGSFFAAPDDERIVTCAIRERDKLIEEATVPVFDTYGIDV
jgi:hypothetical protein